MKRKAMAGLAGLLGAICLAANAWAGGLVLSADRLEFGKMKEGLVAKKVVNLKNSGPGPVRIANVTTS